MKYFCAQNLQSSKWLSRNFKIDWAAFKDQKTELKNWDDEVSENVHFHESFCYYSGSGVNSRGSWNTAKIWIFQT